MCTVSGMTFRAPPCILDVVLDGCTIYKLLIFPLLIICPLCGDVIHVRHIVDGDFVATNL